MPDRQTYPTVLTAAAAAGAVAGAALLWAWSRGYDSGHKVGQIMGKFDGIREFRDQLTYLERKR